MPFTFTHPAAVLPLAPASGKWFSTTALVIGSITPDFEYFFRMRQYSRFSHTWTGMFWFDLPLGLALLLLFNYIIKIELTDHLPAFLNRRFSAYRHSTRNLLKGGNLAVVLFSLLIGIASHLCWDKLIHHTVSSIEEELETYTVYWVLNSIVGALIIASVVWKMRAGIVTKRKNIVFFWLMILLIALIVLFLRYLSTRSIRALGTSAISGFIIGLIIVSGVGKFRKGGKLVN